MTSSKRLDVDRLRRVLALFQEARTLPKNDRVAFVRAMAGDDTLIEEEVARRLIGWERLNAQRSVGLEFDLYYDLMTKLGEGGMGVVYLARQLRLDRLEAVKKIKTEDAVDSEAVRILAAEARASAALRHPGIVQIYAVGSHHGQPAYAMEYVTGGTLQDRLAHGPLPPHTAAELVAQIADAVHFAHQSGIVHRDLKPSNILLDGNGLPKVADFGLARGARDRQELISGLAGTPAYMSPEQAARQRIGPASDVHALGAVLVALLTGRPPFTGDDVQDVLRRVRHSPPEIIEDPATPIPRGLQAICMRCLQKRPERRYPTAAHVGAALRQWMARPKRIAYIGSALIILLMIGGLSFMAMFSGHEADNAKLIAQRERAERLKQKNLAARNETKAVERDLAARRSRYAASMKLAQEALDVNDYGRVIRLLEEQRPGSDAIDMRGFEWHWLQHVCHRDSRLLGRHGAAVNCVVWLNDGRTVISGGADGLIRLWDAKNRQLLGRLIGHQGAVQAAMASGDDALLATAGDDGVARLWNLRSQSLLAELAGPGGSLAAVAISCDGQRLAAGVRDRRFSARVRLWDLESRKPTDLPPEERAIHSVAFSPRGDLLAVGIGTFTNWDTPCDVLLYRLDTGASAAPQRLAGHRASIASVMFSPDGRVLASGSRDESIRLWDVADRKPLRTLDCHEEIESRILSIAISPDSSKVVSAGMGGSIRVWDIAEGIERFRLYGRRDIVHAVAWSPDGSAIVSGSDDGDILLSNAVPPSPDAFQADDKNVMGLAISPDCRAIATCTGALGQPGDVRVWELPIGPSATPRVIQSKQLRCHAAAFSPNGKLLAIAGGDWNSAGRIELWDASSGRSEAIHLLVDKETREELRQQQDNRTFRAATCVAFSPDGKLFASGGGIWGNEAQPGLTRVWEVTGGRTVTVLRGTPMVRAIAFSPDGHWLATAGNDSFISLYETKSWQRLAAIRVESDHHVLSLSFSPDGHTLAAAVSALQSGRSATVQLYGVPAWSRLVTLEGHKSLVFRVIFSPDGSRLATAAFDHTARIWDRLTGHELARYRLEGGGSSAAFSRDGRYLAVGLHTGAVRVFDIGPPSERTD